MTRRRPSRLPGRLAAVAVLAYPPSFRDRYGAEQRALVDDRGASWRDVGDLVVGAVRAWARPTFVGAADERLRQRRQATLSTVWVGWCAVFVGSPALLRLLEDPPPAGFRPGQGGWLVLHDLVDAATWAGWALVLLAGVPLGVSALRHGGPPVRRAVLPPVGLLAVAALMALPLWAYAQDHWIAQGRSAAGSEVPGWWSLLGLAFLVVLAAAAGWGTLGFAVGLRRARFSAQRLRLPTGVAALLVLPMAVVVAVDLLVLAGAGPSAAGPFGVVAVVDAAVQVAAVVAAATASVRTLAWRPAAP